MLTLLQIPLSAFRRFWLDNASVSVMTCRKGFPRLMTLNETWHLNELQPGAGEPDSPNLLDHSPDGMIWRAACTG